MIGVWKDSETRSSTAEMKRAGKRAGDGVKFAAVTTWGRREEGRGDDRGGAMPRESRGDDGATSARGYGSFDGGEQNNRMEDVSGSWSPQGNHGT